jgi:hypothetical protein
VDGVDLVTIEQNPLRKGGFPRVNMRADPDVPHLGNGVAHFNLLSSIKLDKIFIGASVFRSAPI